MESRRPVVHALCSGRWSSVKASGRKSGTVYYRTLLGLFDPTSQKLCGIPRFACPLAGMDVR